MSIWDAIIADENRKLANSNRRYRRHCNSLDAMSEEFTYRLSMERYLADELGRCHEVFDFTDTIENEQLAAAIRSLTEKQRRVVELSFWEGMKQKEIAAKMGCSPAAISKLLSKALDAIASYLTENK